MDHEADHVTDQYKPNTTTPTRFGASAHACTNHNGLREPLIRFNGVKVVRCLDTSPNMANPISSIRNLGPAYEESCRKIGINSAEELQDLGADETYRRLLQAGTKPHFIGYYVLVMALQGRPWNDCKGEEKKELRVIFDKIKAEAFDEGRGAFEQMMNQIGVRTRSP